MKIRPVGADLLHVYGLDAVVAFRNFANAPKNESGGGASKHPDVSRDLPSPLEVRPIIPSVA